jgi:hypothetical protein
MIEANTIPSIIVLITELLHPHLYNRDIISFNLFFTSPLLVFIFQFQLNNPTNLQAISYNESNFL